MKKAILSIFSILFYTLLFAQPTATIYGEVKDEEGKVLEFVNVAVVGGDQGTVTDKNGKYSMEIPAGKTIKIAISFLGFTTQQKHVMLKPDEKYRVDVSLKSEAFQLPPTVIEKDRMRNQVSMVKIPLQSVTEIPTITGGIEGILKTLPGVVSSNELSTQYSVRGGNYDENLVYVNDFEIYRPFLVRSGQQEGLSFVNSDLVGNVLFSSGGFQAKYGDKMSSVLDIRYKKARKFGGSASLSLLGGSFHLEGSNVNQRFHYVLGFRQKSNQYLLSSLEEKGDYRPSFTDIQSYLVYDLTTDWELEFIANYSRNLFRFVPEERITTTGVVNRVIRLSVYFEGQEVDEFQSMMGGTAIIYKPSSKFQLKWLASGFYTREREAFDIIGQYWLDEVETSFGKDDFGESAFNLGVGTFHNWARNDLEAWVANFGQMGFVASKKHYFRWGVRMQHEIINDKLSEWGRLDSAGYSLPFSNEEVMLASVTKSKFDLESNRYSGYIQDTWSLSDSNELNLTGGSRVSYWDLNNELLVSPRMQFSFKPKNWKKDIVFRIASGYYNQPPFYRELRDLAGNINTNVKAQKSIHFVFGSDYQFETLKRPFKLVAEIYYKKLSDLIPYEYDNVRIRYFGENSAHGYAAGIDMRLYGEFVDDADSWISISVMETKEDIDGDFTVQENGDTVEVGYIPRPTDQRLNVGMYFQDYFPNNKNFKVHLNFLFGSGLPFGPPDHERQKDTLRIPPYRRVDIGFSALLLDGSKEQPSRNIFRKFTSIWASLEIFNLLGVANTVSYLWVKDISNTVYAMPNFLTSRRVNFKIIGRF